MKNLRESMDELMTFVKERLEQGLTDHWQLCQETADKFDLWDGTDSFPLWLSFVVQGEMGSAVFDLYAFAGATD